MGSEDVVELLEKSSGPHFSRFHLDGINGLNSQEEQPTTSKTESMHKQPFIIGVAGGTASGKTTVCQIIIEQLRDHRVVLICQNAAYLAQSQGLDIVDSVIKALHSAGYNNQTNQRVMIQSVDSAVLIKLKESTNYTLVYKVNRPIGSILPSAIQEIKKFASAVSVGRESVFTLAGSFTSGLTGVVKNITSGNLTAYVYDLRNEFTSIYFDFFADPNTQAGAYLNTGLSGLSTGFPATAKAYLNNACYNLKNAPLYKQIPLAGSLLSFLQNPPPSASAPYPSLSDTNVTQQALPPVTQRPPTTIPPSSAPPPQPPSSAPQISSYSTDFYVLMLLLFSLLLHA